MRAVLQRVKQASVTVDDDVVGAIGPGLLVLVGIAPGDGAAEVTWLVDKVAGLRIFADDKKPMNVSVSDMQGEVLLVSQFTLLADTRRGRRPGFSGAAPPEQARPLFDQLVAAMGERLPVQTGVFGADMQVALVNDGPVTLILDSA